MKRWFLGLLAAVAALLGVAAAWRRKQAEADEASKRVFEDNEAAAADVRESMGHLQARAQRRANERRNMGVPPSSEDTEELIERLRREKIRRDGV